MIGKVISALLKANAPLLVLVPTGNIYPYVINENTTLPAIVYLIDSIEAEYTKDGWAGDNVTFSIISFEKDYAALQAIVTLVRTALELKSGTTSSITYWNILLESMMEGYNIDENVFLNKLTFSTRVESYS